MAVQEICPKCNVEVKSGWIASEKFISNEKTIIINEFNDETYDTYCNKCGDSLYEPARLKLISERKELFTHLESLISNVPVVSIHSPMNWDYEILELVTSQSTTGTGFISEFTSSFADIFGTQSGQYNKKLKSGETRCITQLRKQALDLGANAIIATDIDYAEVGGLKGMLMVCMSGTAIKLKNVEILRVEKSEQMNELISLNKRLLHLTKYTINEF